VTRGDKEWICTYTGRKFWPMDPRPEDIDILDVAHALSNLCRFGGHCHRFYSVAQHSVHVSQICPAGHALAGLLHDASEAYLVDVPRPIKRAPGMADYRYAEARVMLAVCSHFGVDHDSMFHADVKKADDSMLAAEARDLMGAGAVSQWSLALPTESRVEPWPPKVACETFLQRFAELTVRRGIQLTEGEDK